MQCDVPMLLTPDEHRRLAAMVHVRPPRPWPAGAAPARRAAGCARAEESSHRGTLEAGPRRGGEVARALCDDAPADQVWSDDTVEVGLVHTAIDRAFRVDLSHRPERANRIAARRGVGADIRSGIG